MSSDESPNESRTSPSKKSAPKLTDQQSITSQNLDPLEPILHCSYMLPYRLGRNPRRPEQFVAIPCYHNPTLLYGTMDHLKSTKEYNFLWVGVVTTEAKLSEQEEEQARKVLLEQACYPVFMTKAEITPFIQYYESAIRPKMHNF